MLMGRDQMAVLHSFFIKELCKILKLHLATQKETSLLHFLLKCRYFLPLKSRPKEQEGFVKLIPVLFSGPVFAPYSRAERGRMREWMRTFGVSLPSSAVTFCSECKAKEFPWRGSPGATAAPTVLGCHPRELVASRGGVVTATKPQPGTSEFTTQLQRNGRMAIENHKKIASAVQYKPGTPIEERQDCAWEVSSSGSTEQVGNGTFAV